MVHPLLTQLVKARVRQSLRREGYSLIESIQLAGSVDADLVDTALAASPDAFSELNAMTGLGDGTLIQKFIDFLNSDLGKALIALIMKLLLGL